MVTGFTDVLSTKAFLQKKKNFFFLECRFEKYTYSKVKGNLKREARGSLLVADTALSCVLRRTRPWQGCPWLQVGLVPQGPPVATIKKGQMTIFFQLSGHVLPSSNQTFIWSETNQRQSIFP